MATKKALAATGPDVNKSITVYAADATLESINAAAEVAGAPATASVSIGNATFAPNAEGQPQSYPYALTFTWSESL